jgi:hypothetical protein
MGIIRPDPATDAAISRLDPGDKAFWNPLAEKHFSLMCSLIRSRWFLLSADAAGCLLIMLSDETLRPAQLKRLFLELERVYLKVSPRCWYTCFATAELVRDFPVESALKVFLGLSKSSNETARSHVPHAFEHIIADSGSERLAAIALSKLKEMELDPSPRVGAELRKSLMRIRGKAGNALEPRDSDS